MTSKKTKTVDVEKSDYNIFLKKALDFHDIVIKALDTENWTAVGLNSVHCVISCCDALFTFHLGIRSISEDHIDAAELLQRLPHSIETREAMTFKRIVAKKNLIAYENREFCQSEALEIAKLTERFYEWATSNLPAL